MATNTFEDLMAWQRAMDLVEEVGELVRKLPKYELHELSSQMRKAVYSIPSNIAEGNRRDSLRDYLKFLNIARGSHGEIYTQIYICVRMHYLTKEQVAQALDVCAEVGRLLNGLIASLEAKLENN